MKKVILQLFLLLPLASQAEPLILEGTAHHLTEETPCQLTLKRRVYSLHELAKRDELTYQSSFEEESFSFQVEDMKELESREGLQLEGLDFKNRISFPIPRPEATHTEMRFLDVGDAIEVRVRVRSCKRMRQCYLPKFFWKKNLQETCLLKKAEIPISL